MGKYIKTGLIFIFCLFLASATYAQIGQEQLTRMFQQQSEGLIRIAEPGQLADTLNVWGDITSPGRYLVPIGTTIPQLISYAKGPIGSRGSENLGWSKIKIDISLSKFDPRLGHDVITNFKYSYNKPLPNGIRKYQLSNNEVLSIQVRRKPAFVDYLGVITPVISSTLTAIIIYQQVKK